jgi:Core-2/I-Branching enzyme
MSELAVVILAHRDPVQLKRLVAALDDVPVFLHCDARTSDAVAGEMLRDLPPRVTVVPRRRMRISSWSLVAAELDAVRAALEGTGAEHIAVLSGTDYPLVSTPDLVEELAPWRGRSYFWNVPLPFRSWDTPRHPDGGLWRLRHRFLTWDDNVLFWRRIPLRWPLPRRLPGGMELRGCSQFKIYARHHAARLLHVADTRPDVVRFWRSALVPDETFPATVLATPDLAGDDPLPTCRANPWYIRWPETGGPHPRWLGIADFGGLVKARWAEPLDPDAAFRPSPEQELPGRKLFARKFATDVDTKVLDRIDADLRA